MTCTVHENQASVLMTSKIVTGSEMSAFSWTELYNKWGTKMQVYNFLINGLRVSAIVGLVGMFCYLVESIR